MLRNIQTVVLACAIPSLSARIVRALAPVELMLEAAVQDASEAYEALFRFRPDLLITDSSLPILNGITLTARILNGHAFPVRPAVLLIVHGSMPLPESVSAAQILRTPFSDADFFAAIDALRNHLPVFPSTEIEHAEALLDALGVPAHIGRECLKYAALLCAADERFRIGVRKSLYPQVGMFCACTVAQAERAMRHVIDLAWRSDKVENQYRIFRDTIDARRGQPTCLEMISRLADILSLEG